MRNLRRYAILSFVSLFLMNLSLVGQQKDDVLSQGKDFLKNYQPPKFISEEPRNTPSEAWKQLQLDKSEKKGNFPIRQGRAIMYPRSAEQQNLINRLNESKTPKSKEQIRGEMKLRQEESARNGNSAAAQLRKKGISVAEQRTKEERLQNLSVFVNEDRIERNLREQKQPTTDEIREKFNSISNPRQQRISSASGLENTVVISGYVFSDENKDGIWDTTETGVAGAEVFLYKYYAGITYTDTTDSSGYYEFSGLAGGDYFYPYSGTMEGWYRTYNGGNSYHYLYEGDTLTGINYGFWKIPPRSISGMMFNDLNHDGVKDTLEPGLAGWEIEVYEYETGNYFYTTTDSTGYYSVDSLFTIYYYYVSVGQQFRWLITYPYYGSYELYLDDTSLTNIDFGAWYVPPFAITGMKFEDANGNGQQDLGEAGLAGWTINIYNYNTDSTVSLVTDSLGLYAYYDSGDAGYYNITEQNQDGWMTTYPWQSQDAYYEIYMAGDTATNVDFGNWYVPPGAIYGMKFNDINEDGVKDSSEPGLAGWKIIAVRQVDDTTVTYTDSLGMYSFENLQFGQYYIIEEQVIDWTQSYPGGISASTTSQSFGGGYNYYDVFIAGNTMTDVDFGNFFDPPPPMRVNTMPGNEVSITYANALVGQEIDVWGNAHGGHFPQYFILDYGDGTVDSGEVTDQHYIGFKHTYATAGPKTIRLTVTDDSGYTDTDESVIRVYPLPSQQIRTNMAIEKGLLYLYLNQYPDGRWTDNSSAIAATGASLLSFQENGHKHTNDIDEDIYAEYVGLGLDYLFNQAAVYNISSQPAGDPDSDGDGIGVYFSNDTYTNGIANLAVIGAHTNAADAQADTIRTGAYAGHSYYDYAVDMVDQWAFSQTDAGYYGRGGWRYGVATPNYGSQDNSTTQWAALDLEAAQNNWGIAVPQFVKDELLLTLQATQNANGGFGYETNSSWLNITKTAAAIGSYSLLGATTATPAVANAMNFLNVHWNDLGSDDNGWTQHTSGNTYAMYGVAKGMRIINNRAGEQFIGTHDWYAEYVDHLLDHPTWKQNSNGSWPRSGNYPTGAMGNALNSSLAILVLTRGVVLPPPVAVITPMSGLPPNTSFQVDGSGSFHQDPEKYIIEWLWDFNASDGIDWNSPNASGQRPTYSGYADTGTYTISLRVKDNSDPPLYSTSSATIRIRKEQNPPVAVAIPPERGSSYAAKVGEPILLDGSGSYDPDYPRDSVIAYSWDLNGDGVFGDATTDTITVTFYSEHEGQVGLRVFDTRGDSSSNSAYITIVASHKDLFVQSFAIETDSSYPSGSVDFSATFKNDAASNTNATNVLVRFYDNDPHTIGNQLGGNFYVNLPIGTEASIQTTIQLPAGTPSQARQFFVYLDPANQQAEWDEVNNIASSTAELFVSRLTAAQDTVYLGDTLQLQGIYNNDASSNIELEHVLVRFHSDSLFSPANQIGSDYYVELPVGGSDTVIAEYPISEDGARGQWSIFTVVDADSQVVETNEENNTAELFFTVVAPPSHIVLEQQCLNFGSIEPGNSYTINVNIMNEGPGKLYIDSIFSTDAVFTFTGDTTRIPVGDTMTLAITCTPSVEGIVSGELWLYTTDGSRAIALTAQGALTPSASLKQMFKGLATYNGTTAAPGSVVGAYTANGALIASTIVTDLNDDANYNLKLWKGQAGLMEGDPVFFKVWTGNCEWSNERYCEPALLFTPVDASDDSTVTLHTILASDPLVAEIPLVQRYNAVSWNVVPMYSSVQTVFDDLLATGKVKILLDFINDGTTPPYFDYYIPELGNYNTFKQTNFRKGYFVMLHDGVDPDLLSVTGQSVCPTLPLELHSGYNLVSYLPANPESTFAALGSLAPGNLSIALDFVNDGSGNEWFNFYPSGGFDVMTPGKGYFINVNSPDILTYPENTPTASPASAVSAKQPARKQASLTSVSLPFAVFAYGTSVTINNSLVPAGTEIKAVDADGIICGSAKFVADGVFALPMYADDPATTVDEGAVPGEQVTVIIGNQVVSERVVWTEFGDTRRLDGDQQVTGISDYTGIPKEFGLQQNYPNPFNPTTVFSFQLPVASHITLTVFNMLGQEVATLVDGMMEAGYKKQPWDASGIPSGVYYYRMEAVSAADANRSFMELKKMVLLK
ncbi:MAG: T9SS type A sorting domain-containing protein [Bacteroidetes bacterium]|nr:MAG: T9SS type A sorting domain-containing protein [Bacteroidota bacterium]